MMTTQRHDVNTTLGRCWMLRRGASRWAGEDRYKLPRRPATQVDPKKQPTAAPGTERYKMPPRVVAKPESTPKMHPEQKAMMEKLQALAGQQGAGEAAVQEESAFSRFLRRLPVGVNGPLSRTYVSRFTKGAFVITALAGIAMWLDPEYQTDHRSLSYERRKEIASHPLSALTSFYEYWKAGLNEAFEHMNRVREARESGKVVTQEEIDRVIEEFANKPKGPPKRGEKGVHFTPVGPGPDEA
eukprot:GILJ01011727.1.p1 GENE.GILJ01011727.1~~GILJ01011727.1.p1  ORF type:complete len:255 (-),score=16.39 GILJ01011727.1:408-1133(-)